MTDGVGLEAELTIHKSILDLPDLQKQQSAMVDRPVFAIRQRLVGDGREDGAITEDDERQSDFTELASQVVNQGCSL